MWQERECVERGHLKFESFVNYIRQTVGKNRLELGAKMQDRGAYLIAKVTGVLPIGRLGSFCST